MAKQLVEKERPVSVRRRRICVVAIRSMLRLDFRKLYLAKFCYAAFATSATKKATLVQRKGVLLLMSSLAFPCLWEVLI